MPLSIPGNFLLKAGHDILNTRNCGKYAFNDVVVRCGVRGSILSVALRLPLSFSKPVPLGYDLYKYLSISPTHL